MLSLQILTVALFFGVSSATKPPGYIEKPKIHDPNPPNYDFGYSVSDEAGNKQGHGEHRDGEHTQGHYYIDLPKESSVQDVKYLADDWGFHPLVQYSSNSPHSSSSTTLALGEQAVKRLAQDSSKPLPKGTTPIAPLLAGTVLPAGTSTNGFIHHDNKNGIQTIHSMEPILATVETIPHTAQPQFVQIQPQIGTLQIKSVPTPTVFSSHTNIQHNTRPSAPQAYNELQIPRHNTPFLTGPGGVSPTFDNRNVEQPEAAPVPASLISDKLNAGLTSYDDISFTLQGQGGYGSKLSADNTPINRGQILIDNDRNLRKEKLPATRNHFRVSTTTEIPFISSTIGPTTVDYSNADIYAKLVSSTQNLVSNEDLLSINGAAEVEEAVDTAVVNDHRNFNSVHIGSAPNLITNQQQVVHVQPSQNEYTLRGSYGRILNSNFRRPSGAGIIAIENGEGNDGNKDFVNPIVVADFESEIKSTTQAPFSTIKTQFHDSNLYSTTQSTLETEITSTHNYLTSHSYSENPTSTTVVVTPRPVSQKFLAPLNAGLRLVNSNKVDFLDFSDIVPTSDVKEVEDEIINQENIENSNGVKTVVELFRSHDLSPEPQPLLSQTHNVVNQQLSNIIQTQHLGALESSKKIQDNLSDQLYQLGAQQVLIHPSDQKTQLAAEELSQQIEEHQEENVKHESHQQLSHSSSHQESVQSSSAQSTSNSNIQFQGHSDASDQFTQQGINFGTNLNNVVQQGANFANTFDQLKPQGVNFGNSLANFVRENNNQLLGASGQISNSATSENQFVQNNFEKQESSSSQSSSNTNQFSQQIEHIQSNGGNQNEYLIQNQEHVNNVNPQLQQQVSNAIYSPVISQSTEDEDRPMHIDLNRNNNHANYQSNEQSHSEPISSYSVTVEHPISAQQNQQFNDNQDNFVTQQQHHKNHFQGNVGNAVSQEDYRVINAQGSRENINTQQEYQENEENVASQQDYRQNNFQENGGNANSQQEYQENNSNIQTNEGAVEHTESIAVGVPIPVTQEIPYEVHHENTVTVQVPVEKRIPYPVEVEKFIDRPVPVRVEVEKRVPYPVHIETKIPVPYPVEKRVPYPVEVKVEKIVERPVEITRYIDKPYPVEVRVPHPVPVPYKVAEPYPVDRIVEKNIPYPVTVEKIVEKQVNVPYEVKVPYPVETIIEKIVDRPYPVTQYIDKPYPVEKRVPYPVEVERIVEKQVPYPVEVKVPYKVAVPHAVPYPVEKIVEKPYPVRVNVPYPVEKIIDRPYAVAYPVHINVPYHAQQVYVASNGGYQHQYAQNSWANLYNLQQQHLNNGLYANGYQSSSLGQSKYPAVADSYYRRKPTTYGGNTVAYLTSNYAGSVGSPQKNYDSYIGPVPLKVSSYTWNVDNSNGYSSNPHYKYRRSDRSGKGLRIEYGGFKPPLIPSLEIDLQGNPVKRETA